MLEKKMPPKVLIAVQDKVLGSDIFNSLHKYWYSPIKLYELKNIKNTIIKEKPNALITDITEDNETEMNNTIDNIQKAISSNIPFIMIKNNTTKIDKYEKENNISFIDKPVNIYEIIRVLKDMIIKFKPKLQTKILQYKDIQMDLTKYSVLRNNRVIHLGPSEFKILQLFLESPSVIFSRKEIINFVWGKEHNIDLRTIDVHVNRIRTLIKMSYDMIPIIKTVRSLGYCMNLPGENR